MPREFKQRFPIPAEIVLTDKRGQPCKVNTVTVELSYSKGGTNIFSGNREPRGYSVIVQATQVEENSESFMLFSTPGYKSLLAPVARANAKLAAALTAKLAAEAEALATAFMTENTNVTTEILARLKAA